MGYQRKHPYLDYIIRRTDLVRKARNASYKFAQAHDILLEGEKMSEFSAPSPPTY